MRRDPDAFIAAFAMDNDRAEIVVEGPTDVRLLRWLLGQTDVVLTDVSFINTEVDQGGNRQRVLWLSRHATAKGVPITQVRFLIDADFDHLEGVVHQLPVVHTDVRATECYWLTEDCIRKLFHLGLLRPEIDAEVLLEQLDAALRTLAALRDVDRAEDLGLAFQKTKLRSFAKWEVPSLDLRFEPYVRALLQSAGLPASDAAGIMSKTQERRDKVQAMGLPLDKVAHGKDFFHLVSEAVQACGHPRGNAPEIIRASAESTSFDSYACVTEIRRFAAH